MTIVWKLFLFLIVCNGTLSAQSAELDKKPIFKNQDSSISIIIQNQISAHKKDFYRPQSVERFYGQAMNQLVWITKDTTTSQTWGAMQLLDCVLQYGLNRLNYHDKILTYDNLQKVLTHQAKVQDSQKVIFDLFLTDAMLAFMNDLHFGKLNPTYSKSKITSGNQNNIFIESALAGSLKQTDFKSAVLSVQPVSRKYSDLLDYMRLIADRYIEKSNDGSAEDIKLIAINLERLRWTFGDSSRYIEINIPSYQLILHEPDSTYQFKVIVGKPSTQTPALESAITYFNTAPEWKVPFKIFKRELLPKALRDSSFLHKNHFAIYDEKGIYVEPDSANLARVQQNPTRYFARQASGCDNSIGLIVFRFSNIFDVYLHDTPEKILFNRQNRAFSHGCIRVDEAVKLAAILLKYDDSFDKINSMNHAILHYQSKTFNFKKAIPMKITYLTCEMREGLLVKYQDIYGLDKRLQMALPVLNTVL